MLDKGISVLHGYLALTMTTGKRVQMAGPRAIVWIKHASVGMVGNVEGLCCRSTIFSTAFILALGCKPIHLQNGKVE